jgi:hypothetical protein
MEITATKDLKGVLFGVYRPEGRTTTGTSATEREQRILP